MKRFVVAAVMFVSACRHGNPEHLYIKAARTSRHPTAWESERRDERPFEQEPAFSASQPDRR